MTDTNNTVLSDRKFDHIALTHASQVNQLDVDCRFDYEPMLASHNSILEPFEFLGKTMKFPLWISSMTGGTNQASSINKKLAKACADFGLGMGLGSCRPMLNQTKNRADFDLRPIIGEDSPFFGNLGIAQLEELIDQKQIYKVKDLIKDLSLDGLIIHVNPLQEWAQAEGDRFKRPAIDTIKTIKENLDCKIIVKEVGQGFGPRSLTQLIEVGVDAIETAGIGGTNFTKLEIMRAGLDADYKTPMTFVGHTNIHMLETLMSLRIKFGARRMPSLIFSGGIKNFLDGHYLLSKYGNGSAVYAQAGVLLELAQKNDNSLEIYIKSQIDGLTQARNFLVAR